MVTEINAAPPLPEVVPAAAIAEPVCYFNILTGNPRFFSFRN
jgi:hypothetical protein